MKKCCSTLLAFENFGHVGVSTRAYLTKRGRMIRELDEKRASVSLLENGATEGLVCVRAPIYTCEKQFLHSDCSLTISHATRVIKIPQRSVLDKLPYNI